MERTFGCLFNYVNISSVYIHFRDILLPQTTVSKFKLWAQDAYKEDERFTSIANGKSFYLTNYCSLSQRLTTQADKKNRKARTELTNAHSCFT